MENYHNPQPPEGINTSPDHPLLTFLKLLVGMAAVLAFAAWLLGKSGGWLAALIPFSQEVRLSEAYPESEFTSATHPELQAYLDGLTARLIPAMDLPEGMQIRIHYQNDDVENAFATLGGNILLYKGLLKALPNENSLAMLIAHEMAHVLHRHPIRSAGQNLAMSTGFKLLMGYSNVDILGSTGLYTQLHFSRSMETDSDETGLLALQKVYGHALGATDLFKTLNHIRGRHSNKAPKTAFFSTHPLDQQRIDRLEGIASANGWLPEQARITPLPPYFHQWLDYSPANPVNTPLPNETAQTQAI